MRRYTMPLRDCQLVAVWRMSSPARILHISRNVVKSFYRAAYLYCMAHEINGSQGADINKKYAISHGHKNLKYCNCIPVT